jgi:neutral ceramidase
MRALAVFGLAVSGLLGWLGQEVAAAAPLKAGAASADITAPVGTPMFAYTARSGLAGGPDKALQIVGDPDRNLYAKSFVPSRGIHTRVLARAIVIEQGGRKYALVQADLGGLPYDLTQEVLKKIAATGITGERLLLSATHTHASTGPIWPLDSNGYALLGGDAFDPRIFELTATGIADAIIEANGNLTPARLGVGSSGLRNASNNRSFEAFLNNPEVPKDAAAARAASIDPTVTVLRVDDTHGRPIAAWSNFAIHPTSFGDGNLLFSGDNVASAERVSEAGILKDAAHRGVAAPHGRKVVDVWTNSNEGDISPNGSPDTDNGDALQYVPNAYASANMAGTRVGDGILRAWSAARGHMSDSLAVRAKRTFMIFDGTQAQGRPVGPTEALGAGGITLPDGTCSPVEDIAGPGQGKKLPAIVGAGLIPQFAPVSMWSFGSQGVLALPTEVTKQEGLRIRQTLAGESGNALSDVVIAGLTNGYLSYTSTPEEYDACAYEGSFTIFGRHQGPRYLDVARGVMGALLGGPDPASAPEPPETALGGSGPAIQQTADAGAPVAQPAATVRRYERAVFSWHGGDPGIDAARGQTFVTLERKVGAGWQAVGTEEGLNDTTERGSDGVWTETWQFGECDPLGSYRFRVTGMADKGSGPAPYSVISNEFDLQRTAPLTFDPPAVSGGAARLVARYPDPGAGVLLALPRRVRTGSALLKITPPGGSPSAVTARPDAERLRFTAAAAPGSAVEVVSVQDGCGNTGS